MLVWGCDKLGPWHCQVMESEMRRVLRWIAADGGLEHAVLAATVSGTLVEGVVVGADGGYPFGCCYAIRCDAQWRVRALDVHVVGGAALALRADGAGLWHDADGKPVSALAGCIDADLRCSAFTNTLPILRLGAALAQRHEIRVAYVDPLCLDEGAFAAAQAYTCTAPGRYRFDSLESGFTAEIETDADGLVLRYPGLFERVPA